MLLCHKGEVLFQKMTEKSDVFWISVFRAELHQKFPEIIHSSGVAYFTRTTAPGIIMPVIALDQFFFSSSKQLLFQKFIGKFYPNSSFVKKNKLFTSEHNHGKYCHCIKEWSHQKWHRSGNCFSYTCRFPALVDKTVRNEWQCIWFMFRKHYFV